MLASRDNYADTLIDEVRLARKVLGDDPRQVRTVFVGGGTPTLLAAGDLVRMLGAIRDEFGLADDAEITTEANPESVDPRVSGGAPGRRLQPDLLRHAERPAARAEGPGPHAHPRAVPRRASPRPARPASST